jgi:threonine/homoserine/homoserine lactone efflux protein
VAIGQCVWTVAAGLGHAGVLRASEPAFLAIKSAGAAYLIYLGARSLLAARSRAGHESGTGRPALLVSPVRALRQGLVSDLGNPKMAAFFISLLPQFTGSGPASLATFMAFGFLFSVLTFSWLAAYSFAVARARTFIDRPRIRRALDAITGCVLVGLGVRVAAERA